MVVDHRGDSDPGVVQIEGGFRPKGEFRSRGGSDPGGVQTQGAHVSSTCDNVFSKNLVDRRETANETESLRTSYGCVLGISSVHRRQDSTVQILL